MIEGSSEVPVISEPKDIEAIRGADIKDTEYDEFKQYDDNVIEMKSEAKKLEPQNKNAEPQHPTQFVEGIEPPIPEGEIRITDMTREKLQNSVINLLNMNKVLDNKLKEYEARAKRIQQIWCSKEEVKKRYFMLRDNPKAKGVKVTN